MNKVQEQYDAYPYPERDPKDELKRLVVGSPSMPIEIDHYLYGGKRDWQKPMRVLFAGGGTGDGLIQFAFQTAARGFPCDITYLDLSVSAREIAEARAKMRKLTNITFITGSLLDAPKYGPFDYIDCCGVLHHLPDPDAGFSALSSALTKEGGLGGMVYAPLGRSGVYPLQSAFNTLLGELCPKDRLANARQIFDRLPKTHPFKLNPHVLDHKESDAGFYDLLLHSQDRSYSVNELCEAFDKAALDLVSFLPPMQYDIANFMPENFPPELLETLDDRAKMALAEEFHGGIRKHVFYVRPKADTQTRMANPTNPDLVPHLIGATGPDLAKQIKKKGKISGKIGSLPFEATLSKKDAEIIALINGKNSLKSIAIHLGLDALQFNAAWSKIAKNLVPNGLCLFSNFLK